MATPTETRMQRVGGLAGILFFALVAVAIVLSNGGPSAEDGLAKIESYFADGGNRTKLIAAGMVYGLASVGFVVWLSALYARLRRAEGESGTLARVALGAGTVVIALELVSAAAVLSYPLSLDYFDAARSDPQLALGLTGLATAAASLAGIMFAALAAATGILALRARAFSRSFGYASLAAAGLSLIAAASDSAPAVLLLWVLAASVALIRRPRELHAAATASIRPESAAA